MPVYVEGVMGMLRFGVGALLLVPGVALALDGSVPYVRGDQSRFLLGDGTGVVIGVIDSGVDDTHPALTGLDSLGQTRMKAEKNFVTTEPTNTGDDVFGHGTWVTSAILSNDPTFTGMAPDARFINARVLNNSNSFSSDTQIRNGVGFAIDNGADILNLSLNYFAPTATGNTSLELMLDWAAFNRNISAAVIAGNISQAENGYTQVRGPGTLYNGVTVGRTNATFDLISPDSAVATTQDGRSKPDIAAPGTALTLANDDWEGAADWDMGLNGTSFAGPHVAGLMAQQIEYGRAHSLSTTPMVVKATMMNAAVKVLDKGGNAWTHRASTSAGGVLSVTGPLDSDSGAGQIDGVDLHEQYSAGEHEAGVVPAIGWDNGTINGLSWLDYTFDADLIAGSDFTATLTWLRHVGRTDDGDGIVDAGDAFSLLESLDDLNLSLFQGSTLIAESISTIDNVEHLYLPIDVTGAYTLRVTRLSGGGLDENFAVAWSGTVVPEPGSAIAITITLAAMLPRRRVGIAHRFWT